MVEFAKDEKKVEISAIGELLDFVNEIAQKKYTGTIEVQFKKGEVKSWVKMSKFRKLGGVAKNARA
jgi:hypothetical protein